FEQALRDDLVIALVAPASSVVAVSGAEHSQKSVGVRVVADPSGTRNLVGQAVLRFNKRLPFLIAKVHLDAESVLPHFADGFRDCLVLIGSIVKQGEAWTAFAIGETGFR